MSTKRARRHAVLAMAGAVLLVAQAASAAHIGFTFSVASPTTNAYSDTTTTVDYGTTEVVSQTTQLPNGWLVAHLDSATSPITPVPNDGDTVGTGTATAVWEPFCSLNASNLTLTAKWETTFRATPAPPTNTVAQVTITAGSLFNTQAFVVLNGTNDYDIVVDDMPDEFACNGKASLMTLTIYGSVPSSSPARRVAQNPSTAGTYTATLIGTESGGTNHTTNSAGVGIS